MRILRVLTPGADDGVAASVRDAIASFNRGLDIRLRFLSILIEDTELRVEEPESAAELVGAAIEERAPSIVVVQGDEVCALAAATVAARGDRVVAHLGAGTRPECDADTARAIDRVCGLLLPIGDAAYAALLEEGLGDRARRLAAGSPTATHDPPARAR